MHAKVNNLPTKRRSTWTQRIISGEIPLQLLNMRNYDNSWLSCPDYLRSIDTSISVCWIKQPKSLTTVHNKISQSSWEVSQLFEPQRPITVRSLFCWNSRRQWPDCNGPSLRDRPPHLAGDWGAKADLIPIPTAHGPLSRPTRSQSHLPWRSKHSIDYKK